MSRCKRLHLDELLSRSEAAEYVGLSYGAWSHAVARRGVPEPDARLGSTPGWTRETLDRWLDEAAKVRRGRPPKAGKKR